MSTFINVLVWGSFPATNFFSVKAFKNVFNDLESAHEVYTDAFCINKSVNISLTQQTFCKKNIIKELFQLNGMEEKLFKNNNFALKSIIVFVFFILYDNFIDLTKSTEAILKYKF